MLRVLSVFIYFAVFCGLSAQNADGTPFIPDTLVTSDVSDSLTVQDSLKKKNDIDAVVFASGKDSLIFDIASRKMFIFGEGDIKYKKTELKSGKINIDFRTSAIAAEGIKDSTDSTGVSFIETPVLSESDEVYSGHKLTYNFKTLRGYISLAKGESDGSKYQGEKVKKINKETFFIEQGAFTSCECDTPSTYFYADKMKVINQEQIIARWIWMYIAGVPVPVPLPFAVIPNKSGRRSGILPPGYSIDNARGQAFTNFGYFWAMSDYTDMRLTADYFSRGSFALRNNFRYVKRYDFQGNIDASYARSYYGDKNDPNRRTDTDWSLRLYHNQVIDPTMNLNAQLNYASSNYINNYSFNYNERLNQNISSSASLSKSYEFGNFSLNYRRNQVLSSGDISEELPSLRFSLNTFYPFRKESSVGSSGLKWYENITMSYSADMLNRRDKSNGNLKIRNGLKHNAVISFNSKIGYINVSPSINYNENWHSRRSIINSELRWKEYDEKKNTDIYEAVKDTVREKGLFSSRMITAGITLSTKIYGNMQPGILGVEAFRHVISPWVSFSYVPSMRDYNYGSYYISPDKKQYYSYDFDEVLQLGSPTKDRKTMNWSLNNVFEVKTMKDPNDTTSQAQKIELLNLNFRGGYDFSADSLRLGDLSVEAYTRLGNMLNVNAHAVYSFYSFNGTTGNKIDKFLIDDKKYLMRLMNFSLNLSTNIAGDEMTSDEPEEAATEKEETPDNIYADELFAAQSELEKKANFKIPWRLNLNYSYSYDQHNPTYKYKNSDINLDLSFNLTPQWKIQFRGGYDIFNKEFGYPQIDIYRELNCWEMNFSWQPIGQYRGFRFEIRMTPGQLRDIKVTKSTGRYTGYGY